MRLDVFLTESGLVKSRERAKELIKAGQIIVDGKKITKPAYETEKNPEIKIVGEQLKYVGRGGLKLEKAIVEFGIELAGLVCLRISRELYLHRH